MSGYMAIVQAKEVCTEISRWAKNELSACRDHVGEASKRIGSAEILEEIKIALPHCERAYAYGLLLAGLEDKGFCGEVNKTYQERVLWYEAKGLTTSDAQAAVDAEIRRGTFRG